MRASPIYRLFIGKIFLYGPASCIYIVLVVFDGIVVVDVVELLVEAVVVDVEVDVVGIVDVLDVDEVVEVDVDRVVDVDVLAVVDEVVFVLVVEDEVVDVGCVVDVLDVEEVEVDEDGCVDVVVLRLLVGSVVYMLLEVEGLVDVLWLLVWFGPSNGGDGTTNTGMVDDEVSDLFIGEIEPMTFTDVECDRPRLLGLWLNHTLTANVSMIKTTKNAHIACISII
jgi:hypothetical protein